MRIPARLGLLAAVVAGGSTAACGEDEPQARVTFTYQGRSTLREAVARDFPECVALVGETHIHPGWRSFRLYPMVYEGGAWTITFDDVPVGTEARIRVSDADYCDRNETGASIEGVRANDVLLSRNVLTPGTGLEPGLAFSVLADGTVIP